MSIKADKDIWHTDFEKTFRQRAQEFYNTGIS